MNCPHYIPWHQASNLLKTAQCHLWDETKQRCERNEDCPQEWVKSHGTKIDREWRF